MPPGVLGGAGAVLGPGVLAAAFLNIGSEVTAVRQAGYLLLGLTLAFAAVWFYSLWAFHIARPSAPPARKRSDTEQKAECAPPPVISLEWSADADEFPEDFAPLLALKQIVSGGHGVTGALVNSFCVKGHAQLRAGSHELRISKRSSLQLFVKSSKKCKFRIDAQPAKPDQEAVASNLCLELPGVQLSGVAGALDSLWDLWTESGHTSAMAGLFSGWARKTCVLLLRAMESALPIRLSTVEGIAAGEQFLLFFTGAVGPIPFERIHLPTFVLPRLHAPLSRLLTSEPLMGHRFHRSATPPTPHPGALESWSMSLDAAVSPVDLNVKLHMRDGSCSSVAASVLSEERLLRVQCESSGKLDSDSLWVELSSFRIQTSAPGNSRGLSGQASLEVSIGKSDRVRALGSHSSRKLDRQLSEMSSTGNSLPDILFAAACNGTLGAASLDVVGKMSLNDSSELPEPLRVTIRDEHPLMMGCANVAMVLERTALRGNIGVRGDLPMRRKRDLLQLPDADLRFDAQIRLEEETSFVDDGYATVRFHGIRGRVEGGHIWSEDELCLSGKASVSAAGTLTVEQQGPSLVQALIEAETAAARLGGGGSGHGNRGRSAIQQLRPRLASAGEEELHTSVRPGDKIHISVGGSAKASAACQLRLSSGVQNQQCSPSHKTPPSSPRVSTSVPSPVVRDRAAATSFAVVDDPAFTEGGAEGRVAMPALRVSLADSTVSLELGEFRAQVGDLALTLPPFARIHANVVEAEINAEGIGQTHLHASWEGLGRPVVDHTAKQRKATLPPLPNASGFTVHIGDMGQVTITLDEKLDTVALGNRILDDEDWHGSLLELAAMLNLEPMLQWVMNFARVVRNVLRSENISEPKDVVPAPRLARILARTMREIGSNGQHTADEGASELEADLRSLVEQAVEGKGFDVNKVTRLMWDSLPPEACSFVQEHTAEADFICKWFDSLLLPTEATSGPDPSKLTEDPPSHKYRRDLQDVAPCASRLYEVVERPGKLERSMEDQIGRAAPYLTTMQVEHLLKSSGLSNSLRQRLKFLLALKRRVEKVGKGYGGPAFMPQGMAVGFFLATAIRGSFVGTASIPSEETAVGAGSPATASPATLKLSSILREQRLVAQELCRLQERQRHLSEEALQLAMFGEAGSPGLSGPSQVSTKDHHSEAAAAEARTAAASVEDTTSMLACLVTGGQAPPQATQAVCTNAARCFQRTQAAQAASSHLQPEASTLTSSSQHIFDLGCSLMGPAEVAVLLQSGLAAVPQGRQVQQNQRMLLEMMVSQPPLFLKGVLYELSNNGSTRVLGNHLLALLDLSQNAVRPCARLDVADLLTASLGIHMPKRSDFMAGGSFASSSYLLFIHRAAKQVLEECEPYVALKHWLQRSERPLPTLRRNPVPSATRAWSAAMQAIRNADEVGATWLKERGPAWGAAASTSAPESPARSRESESKKVTACNLYRTAFKACADAFKASYEVLHADWFHEFWVRNYDALTVVSVLRNLQDDVDKTRLWFDAQLRNGELSSGFKGEKQACDELYLKAPKTEACLLDCLLEVLFFKPEDRDRYREDSLMQLIIDEPSGHFDFTVVSAMGVITDGAKGTEMASTYKRLLEQRGVRVVRADTATLQSVDYNAACVEQAVREHVTTPWGWVGYSQGCANAFCAEAMMLQGTPKQQRLMDSFRCRQLLFSAANGSAHATCGDWKLLRALVDGERFLKRFQASMSAATQNLALDLLQNALSSRLAFAVLGSVQSLTHEGARKMWRDGQHCHRAPTTSIRGIVEPHTLPECLMMLSNVLLQQMDYSKHQDTQVAAEEAVAHPIGISNSNADHLKLVDMQSAPQRTHHWSPLNEEVKFLTTTKDEPLAMFDTPKDRHIFPWLEVNARFGVIDRTD